MPDETTLTKEKTMETLTLDNGVKVLKNPETRTMTITVNGLTLDITVEERKGVETTNGIDSRAVNVYVVAKENENTSVARTSLNVPGAPMTTPYTQATPSRIPLTLVK